jgi:hypothetical protein
MNKIKNKIKNIIKLNHLFLLEIIIIKLISIKLNLGNRELIYLFNEPFYRWIGERNGRVGMAFFSGRVL